MVKYFSNYFASGKYLTHNLGNTNLQKAIGDIRKLAEGNRTAGNKCTWYVFDCKGACVALGGMNCNGKRFRWQRTNIKNI